MYARSGCHSIDVGTEADEFLTDQELEELGLPQISGVRYAKANRKGQQARNQTKRYIDLGSRNVRWGKE